MKTSHTPIVKAVIEQMRLPAANKITVQRVAAAQSGKRYVQFMTALGVVTIRDAGALTEPDYPIQDVGDPAEWSKVSKGMVVSKAAADVPFTTAQNVALLGDSEIAAAEQLLEATTGLAPFQVICHPGVQIVYADTPGTAIWTYSPSGGTVLTNHTGQWTRNAEACTGIYALIKPWIKSVVYAFPKDSETGLPQKITGVSFGALGSRVGIHIVCKELGMVIGCTGAFCPKESPSSYVVDGNLKCFSLQPDNTFIKLEEEFKVKANLIDMSVLQKQPPSPAVETPKPEVATPPVSEPAQPPVSAPVAAPEPEKPVEVVPVDTKPAVEENTKATETVESVPAPQEAVEPTTGESQAPVAAQPTTEELLNKSIEDLELTVKGARELLTMLKACRKQHKSESKDTKAIQKLQAENAKLKEELAEVKAKAATQEATLNKFKSLLG